MSEQMTKSNQDIFYNSTAENSGAGEPLVNLENTYPEFLTKSAIAKHRSLTGSGFEQSDRRFPQPTVCCQILS
ncbi:hypothetical protein [Crocosphaera watsonii]|uniref:hypothetical protein n=1 Tax=Crocosphaera watsonii TaxID=263511 RepID=UPI0030DA834B